jgi:hypothetical protein
LHHPEALSASTPCRTNPDSEAAEPDFLQRERIFWLNSCELRKRGIEVNQATDSRGAMLLVFGTRIVDGQWYMAGGIDSGGLMPVAMFYQMEA